MTHSKMYLLLPVDDEPRLVLNIPVPDAEYDTLSSAVGGYIQEVTFPPDHPDAPGCSMIINEEGKLRGLPRNPRASALMEGHLFPGDYIVGPAVIVGSVYGESEWTSLDDETIRRLVETLKQLPMEGSDPS